MATTLPLPAAASAATIHEARVVHSVHATLRYVYGIVPIVAGLDKFTNLLANWSAYVNPTLLNALPISPSTLMGVVGVIEIAAGILVLARPRLGGVVVMAWLLAVAAQFLVWGHFLDVAVRDIVMAIGGALTLARLSVVVEREAATRLPSAQSRV